MASLGCGAPGSAPPAPPLAETCAVRLPPRVDAAGPAAETPQAPPPTTTAARSTLVINVEVPLAGVQSALEAKVPRRVAEERDHDLGMAGRLEYTVDRGAFALRMDKDVLVVEAPLLGKAQACARGRCYAGCAPEARVTAHVPLHLDANYKLHTSDVHVDITRGCSVRALGGMLTVDVTPTLRGALEGQARNIQASIDRELPDLRPEAARLWDELGKPRSLPLGACVVLAPEELAQGPAGGSPLAALLRFGLLARPEVRVRCGTPEAAPRRALPPLRDDRAMPPVGDVHLAIVLPADAPGRALEGSEPFDVGRGRVRVAKTSGDVKTGLLVDLAGEACGQVAVRAGGVAWRGAQSLHLTLVAPAPGEETRLTEAGLDGARLGKGLENAPIALPIAVSALEGMLPELARGMSDDRVMVTAAVESAQPELATLRGAEVVAVALLRGGVTLHLR